jgi:hypothetical protein
MNDFLNIPAIRGDPEICQQAMFRKTRHDRGNSTQQLKPEIEKAREGQ